MEMKECIYEILQETYLSQQIVKLQGEEPANEHMRNVLSALLLPPLYTTLRVNTLRDSDVNAVTEAVSQHLIEDYQRRGWPPPVVYRLPRLDDIIVVENRAHLTRNEYTQREVIVDECCGMAVLRGADVFAQGIMAMPHAKVGDCVSVYVDMDGGCLKGATQYDGRKRFVGSGVLRVSRPRLFSRDTLEGVGVEMTEPLYEAPTLSDILPERVFAQNLPSIVCGHVLDPQPGETILDMCAAPGGKTCHIAALVKNQAKIIAVDKSAAKVAKIEKNLARCAVSCVTCHVHDSTRLINESKSEGSPAFGPDMFDRVLLDGPCSALGQRPRWKWDVTEKVLRSYPVYQRKLLTQAVRVLRPGGVLVYSTCTLVVGENEAQVAWLLAKFPEMILEPQEPRVGGPGLPCKGLSDDQCALVQRFDPGTIATVSDVHTDTIGFFIAKFRKDSRS